MMPSRITVLLLCLCVLSFPIFAQQEATISGTVTDPTGAAIAGAQVNVTNAATGVSRTVVTNPAGAYQVPQLAIGTYSVTIKAPGFKTYTKTGVVLNVSAAVRVDAALQLGQATESVTVSADAVQVQADTNEQSNLITGTQIQNLATNGRNVIGLAALGTGVSSALPSFNQPTSVTADNNISFNGQRPQHNEWLIDGGENYDRGAGGKISTMPSQDSIQEFRVLTSNYSADYGYASGGTVSMILRSGTKNFHGQLWEFLRNDAFDANNYIANLNGQPVPKRRYNVYGFNIGGPVYIPGHYNKDKNKTFFFYNQEWRSIIQGTQSTTITDPTPAERSGAFNQPIYVPVDPRLQAAGFAAGSQFPNNTIPASLIDPQAKALLGTGIFPNPTSYTAAGVGQYSSAPSVPLKVHEEVVRIDQNFSDKLSLMGHFIDDMTNQNFATTLWNSTNVPTVGSSLQSPSYSAVVRLTDMISPSAVDELNLQYDGNRLNISPTGLYTAPSGINIPQYFAGDNLSRLPNIQIQGTYGINYGPYWQPWTNAYNSYQFGDDLTITKGRHNMKFGGSLMWFTKNQDGFTNTEGTFTFNGLGTAGPLNPQGNAFADFLLGEASNYSEASAQPRIHTRAYGFGLYALDNWHVNGKLTVNLGLRYEGVPQTHVLDDGLSNFYPGRYDPALAPTFTSSGAMNAFVGGSLAPGFSYVPGTSIPFYSNGLGFTGQNGTPRQLVQNHWNNWGPRIGFAYDVGGNGKTVIRSGFGMFYERIQGNDLYNMIGNPGFATTPSGNNVYLSNPSLSYQTGGSVTGATTVAPPSLGQALAYSDFKVPTSMQWSFGIQHQLAANAVASISYVGNENYHQPDIRNINTPPLGGYYQTAVASGAIPDNTNNQPYNIYPGYANIPLVEDATNSHYESLQVGMNVRDLHGLTINLGYTYSRVIDYMSQDLGGNINGNTMDNQTVIVNPFNRGYDYGPGDMNRDHIFTIAYVYALPVFAHSSPLVKYALGSWELSGITVAETGFPITVYMPNGNSVGLGTNQVLNRPSAVSPMTYPQSFYQWFNTSALSAPALGQFGSLGRNAIKGPGRQNWDVTLMKRFPLGFREGANLEFRADAFNVFNHTEFSTIGTTFGQSTLGQVTNVYDPRVLQLGLTLSF
jgi:hypothetical protein